MPPAAVVARGLAGKRAGVCPAAARPRAAARASEGPRELISSRGEVLTGEMGGGKGKPPAHGGGGGDGGGDGGGGFLPNVWQVRIAAEWLSCCDCA